MKEMADSPALAHTIDKPTDISVMNQLLLYGRTLYAMLCQVLFPQYSWSTRWKSPEDYKSLERLLQPVRCGLFWIGRSECNAG